MSCLISNSSRGVAKHVQVPSSLHLDPRVFVCTAYVHLHKTQHTKLDPCVVQCVCLGFHPHKKGYHCYHSSSRHINVSMDVILSETKYFLIVINPPLVLKGRYNMVIIVGLIFHGRWNFLVQWEKLFKLINKTRLVYAMKRVNM